MERGKQVGHDLSKSPQLRNASEWFAGICEKQLRKDDKNGSDWIHERLDMRFGKIQVLLYSLFFDIHAYTENTGEIHGQRLIERCAELSNSAMMIADQVKRKM